MVILENKINNWKTDQRLRTPRHVEAFVSLGAVPCWKRLTCSAVIVYKCHTIPHLHGYKLVSREQETIAHSVSSLAAASTIMMDGIMSTVAG